MAAHALYNYQTDIDLENERYQQAILDLKRIYHHYHQYLDRLLQVLMTELNHKHQMELHALFVQHQMELRPVLEEPMSPPNNTASSFDTSDRETNIYRLRNKDTVDTEGPAMKKRKLNAGEAQLNTFVEDESSNKSSSISNTSYVHSPHAPPQWLQNTENLPPKVPHTNSVNSSSTTSSSNSFGITFANTSNQTAMTSTNKPLLNKSITKPLSNDTFFHVNTKPKRKKFSIKTKGKGKRKGKRKQKQLKWFENQAIFQKTKVLGTLFHRVWKKVDWKSVSKDDVAWDKLTAFERGTMALAVKGEPMRIDDINKFITENVSGRIDGTGTMILCATRSGKACAAYEDGYYFVLSDTEDSDDEDASDAEDTPGEICKAMWDC
eukprot:180975_1